MLHAYKKWQKASKKFKEAVKEMEKLRADLAECQKRESERKKRLTNQDSDDPQDQ